MNSTVNPVAQTNYPVLHEIVNSKPWQWTVGRADSAVRFAFQALCAAFQVLKIAVKIPLAFLVTPLNCYCEDPGLNRYDFSGVARDVVHLGFTVRKMSHMAIGVLFAPPKQTSSFYSDTLGDFCDNALNSNYQEHHSMNLLLRNYRHEVETAFEKSDLFIDCKYYSSNYNSISLSIQESMRRAPTTGTETEVLDPDLYCDKNERVAINVAGERLKQLQKSLK
jgi:hypothetical protein